MSHIQEILAKELSRRDFLKLVGGALLMAVGVQNFLSYFSTFKASSSKEVAPSSHGFGAHRFGR